MESSKSVDEVDNGERLIRPVTIQITSASPTDNHSPGGVEINMSKRIEEPSTPPLTRR